MIRDSRRKELPTRQQGGTSDEKTQASSRLWFGLKDPRIVRVSRAFGGKDRHSKVSTIRGLRDRRVRLSVPTAIQLYDLQDRLGLNQPSKVVDWLLNAAQHEIDKLPPLQMPPGNFAQFPQSSLASHVAAHRQITSHPSDGVRPLALFSSKASDEVFGKEAADKDLAPALPKLNYWQSNVPQRTRQTEDLMETGVEKGGGIANGNQAESEDIAIHYAQVSAAHAPIPRPNHSSTLALLGNTMSYAPCYNWEPSNNNLSHLGIHPSQVEGPSMPIPSSLASQLVFCPSGAMPSMFHSYMTALNELDGKK